MKIPRTFSPLRRAVIAELCAIAELGAGSKHDGVQMIGAVAAERAASIIRGDTLRVLSNKEVRDFAEIWNATTPAKWNRPGKKR